jgi:hypothetical protein
VSDRWILVGDKRIVRSDLAVTWTTAGINQPGQTQHRVRRRPDGTLLSVGQFGQTWRSTDGGLVWTYRTSVPSVAVNLHDVTWAEHVQLWVAVGTGGNVWTSPDGLSWTSRYSGTNRLRTVVVVDGTIRAYGDAGEGAWSTNGTSWTFQQFVGGTSDAYAVHHAAGVGWLAAGRSSLDGGGRIWRSTNGTSWTAVSLPTSIPGALRDVIYVPELSRWVAVGAAGWIAVSADRISWTTHQIAAADRNFYAAGWSPTQSRLVATTETRAYWNTSPNFEPWWWNNAANSFGGDFPVARSLVWHGANVAPHAPTIVQPQAGRTIHRHLPFDFRWEFSDPNPDDRQSKFDLEIRNVPAAGLPSAPHLINVSQETHLQLWTALDGLFTHDQYEWRVRTYDKLGVQGPFTGWVPFFVDVPPPGPTIVAPADGSTVIDPHQQVQWSAAQQDDWQLWIYQPDTDTLFYDSGIRNQPSVRFHIPDVWPDGQQVDVMVRVRRNQLWSVWMTSSVHVATEPPAEPQVTPIADAPPGAVTVRVVHPPPEGTQPQVASWDLWRRDRDGNETETAAGLPLSQQTHTDWTVGSGVPYRYRVRVVGVTGTVRWGGWES